MLESVSRNVFCCCFCESIHRSNRRLFLLPRQLVVRKSIWLSWWTDLQVLKDMVSVTSEESSTLSEDSRWASRSPEPTLECL